MCILHTFRSCMPFHEKEVNLFKLYCQWKKKLLEGPGLMGLSSEEE